MIIELTERIKLVRPEVKAVFAYSNALFIDDKIKTLIDAGSGGRAYSETMRNEIQLLLLTHHHFDHINGIPFFINARKMAGQEELWAFRNKEKYYESTGYQNWEKLMGSPRDEKFDSIERDDIPSPYGFNFIELDGTFKDDDIIDLGETQIMAVHTPGHAPGHYAFYFPEEKILFSGDLDVTPRGPWYGNEFSNVGDIIQSVNRLMDLKPQILVTSHRRIIDAGVQNKLQDYLGILLQREELIYHYLIQPRTLDDIADQNFIKGEANNSLGRFHCKMMIIQHLRHLNAKGLIRKTEDNRYIKA